jgi:hypothetical protein
VLSASRSALLLTALIAAPAFAGRSKMIELKNLPKTAAGVAAALEKEKKDLNRRSVLSLLLDDMVRKHPEVTDPELYDQLVGSLLNDVLDKMAEPTESFSTEYGPDKFHPRADIFFREEVKVKPGRVTKEFKRKLLKKPGGKNIDRGYRDQPLNVLFTAAASDEAFQQWTDSKSWGVVIHAAHVDPTTGIARIGCTFVTNGSKEAPGGHFERPSWIAFYKQPVPGHGFYQPLAIERVTAIDWREQPLNLVPPKVEPIDLAKRLYLEVWMEQVRALPNRAAFLPQEQELFELQLDGPYKIEAPQLAMLEPYRDSDSPMVRAAAELKIASLNGPWKPDSIWVIAKGVKHPVVKARLEEQLKKAPAGWSPPALPSAQKDEPDAGPMKGDAGRPGDAGH